MSILDILHCDLCLHSFDDLHKPQVLRCGDTFCSVCIENRKKESIKESHNGPCPNCGEAYALQIVKPNLTLLRLMHAVETEEKEKKEELKNKCGMHKYTLEYYCSDCKIHGCAKCILSEHKFHVYFETNGSVEGFKPELTHEVRRNTFDITQPPRENGLSLSLKEAKDMTLVGVTPKHQVSFASQVRTPMVSQFGDRRYSIMKSPPIDAHNVSSQIMRTPNLSQSGERVFGILRSPQERQRDERRLSMNKSPQEKLDQIDERRSSLIRSPMLDETNQLIVSLKQRLSRSNSDGVVNFCNQENIPSNIVAPTPPIPKYSPPAPPMPMRPVSKSRTRNALKSLSMLSPPSRKRSSMKLPILRVKSPVIKSPPLATPPIQSENFEKFKVDLMKFSAVSKTNKLDEPVVQKQVVENVNFCKQCSAEYTFFSRRHECKMCSGVYCDSCSSSRMIIPDEKRKSLSFFNVKKYVRVCDSCASKLSFDALQLTNEHVCFLKKCVASREAAFRPFIWQLKYQASKHGFGAKDFHACCDNKHRLLVVVKTVSGFLFGGYSSLPFSKAGVSGTLAPDDQSFLFTLVNPHNLPPTMFLPKASVIPDVGPKSHPDFGPRYGRGNGQYTDLAIFDEGDIKGGWSGIGHELGGYIDTTGIGMTLFAGGTIALNGWCFIENISEIVAWEMKEF